MKEILKEWGKELWIAEEAEYGGKILIVKENKGTSQHYHKDKKETIYCFKGLVDIILIDKIVTLKEGEDLTLLPKSTETLGAQFTVGSLINAPCYPALNMRPLGKFSNLHVPIGKLVKLFMNFGTTGHSSISLPFFGVTK